MKYELSVKGMKCSNCSNKLEDSLKQISVVKSVNVNLITEKAHIVVENSNGLKEVTEMIGQMGFMLNEVKDLNKIKPKNRVIRLAQAGSGLLPDKSILQRIRDVLGVQHVEASYDGIRVEYDPDVISGRELIESLDILVDGIENVERSHVMAQTKAYGNKEKYKYHNEFVHNILSLSAFKYSFAKWKIIQCVALIAVLLLITMLDIPFLKDHYILTRKLNLFILLVIGFSFAILSQFGYPLVLKSIKVYFSSGLVNMDTLISIGCLSSLFLGVITFVKLYFITTDIDNQLMMAAHSFETSAAVIAISTIGKSIEEHAKVSIRNYSSTIFSKYEQDTHITWMKPRNRKFVSLVEKSYDAGLLEVGDCVKLHQGEYVLCDCSVVSGQVETAENITCGHDITVVKSVGDKLKSGCKVSKGSCVVMIESVVEESFIYKLVEEMTDSLNKKLQFQHFIDKIVRYFVPFVVVSSLLTFLTWIILSFIYIQDFGIMYAAERAISILVVSCPCAFGLAIPTVTTIALNKALDHGILVKNVSILPEVRNANCFVFDKTGTLTEIVREVNIEYDSRNDDDALLLSHTSYENIPLFEMIALSEKGIKHPLAEVLYSFCFKKRELDNDKEMTMLANANEGLAFTSPPEIFSNGVKSSIKYDSIVYNLIIGNLTLLNQNGIALNQKLLSVYNSNITHKNLSAIFACVNKKPIIVFSIDLTSQIRREAREVIQLLQKNHKETFILSGDSQESVVNVGQKLKIPIDNCIGNADHKKKKEILNMMKQQQKRVLMIGDGVNDILSLCSADFGISFNANSQLNVVASDIVFIIEDLRLLMSLTRLSQLSYVFIWLNIFWAFGYNILMMPISAGLLHHIFQADMSPTLSSFAMFCSSLLILITANTLRLFRIGTKAEPTELKRKKEQEYVPLDNLESSNIILKST